MGLPTVAVSLLTLSMTPTQAAGLLVVPSLLTNIAQCRGPSWRKLVRILWPAWAALVVVTVVPIRVSWPLTSVRICCWAWC